MKIRIQYNRWGISIIMTGRYLKSVTQIARFPNFY